MAVYISTPLILLYLAWRGCRNPAYWRRWRERLGFASLRPPAGGIWVHAVSVGEVNGVLPLVRRLREEWPQKPIIFSCSTPTGSERIKAIFPDLIEATQKSVTMAQAENQAGLIYHCYLPLDLPGAMKRLYGQIQPCLILVMETEIWPNFFLTAADRQLPLALVNARLSQRSASGYRRYLPQARLALNAATAIVAQTEADAKRFIQAGAPERIVHYSGNLKGDLALPKDLSQKAQGLQEYWGSKRSVWLGASTHEGEEMLLLEAHRALLAHDPNALLILIPRHPERFERVLSLVRQAGFVCARHSRRADLNQSTQVLVVDAMGVLLEYAAAAQLTFVGGSLVPVGGHNPLEPAALSKPVLMGPHHENIKDLMTLLVEAGGARVVADGEVLGQSVINILGNADLRQTMGQQALSVVEVQRGAVDRTLSVIRPLVSKAVKQ